MNFKKLAAVAALAVLSTASFAAGNQAGGTASLSDAEALGAEGLLINGDITAGTTFTDVTGNTALVTQVTSSNVAYIEQSADVLNIAVISQSTADDNAAGIYQAGGSNRAVVYQH